MKTANVNLLVFDTKDNFEKSRQFLGEEGSSFKKITCVENFNDFEKEFNNLKEDEYVFLAVHVFYTQNISGVRRFAASSITSKYPITHSYISEGDSKKISHDMVDHDFPHREIYKYHEVQSGLEKGTLRCYTKKQIMQLSFSTETGPDHTDTRKYPQFEYAVITALYENEFEELRKVFDFPQEEIIKTGTKSYYVGYLKSNREKRIIAAFQNIMGMVDASILATQMMELFTPKYILMTGVCGGASNMNLGDIVIASQIFPLQKGKISDLFYTNSDGFQERTKLFDEHKQPIDPTKIYDQNGQQVIISFEKFEQDIDAVINLASSVSDTLKPEITNISRLINNTIADNNFFDNKQIKVVMEPMACSNVVVNKNGYFEEKIKSVMRRTVAVEMESYGVARATQFANNGKTIPIIIKSVMDKTINKEDILNGVNYKKFAAYTSALFLGLILEKGLI